MDLVVSHCFWRFVACAVCRKCLLITKSLSMLCQAKSFLCCNEPGRVVCQCVVFAASFCWLYVGSDVVFPSFGWSSAFLAPFLFGRYRWAPLCNEPRPAAVVVFGNQSVFFQDIVLCLWIHGLIPCAVIRSSHAKALARILLLRRLVPHLRRTG